MTRRAVRSGAMVAITREGKQQQRRSAREQQLQRQPAHGEGSSHRDLAAQGSSPPLHSRSVSAMAFTPSALATRAPATAASRAGALDVA